MKYFFLAFFGLLCATHSAFSQENDEQLTNLILQKDSAFWRAYNTCDVATMQKFVTHDLEFYHDKGGITLGDSAFAASFKNNVCAFRDSFSLRREEVTETVHVYPMHKNGKIYGALISGDHLFYIKNKGQEEHAEGLAKFTQLWVMENGEWKMSRVLSYNHGPAPYTNKRTTVAVSSTVLKKYVGTYNGSQTKDAKVTTGKDMLNLVIGGNTYLLYPSSENMFFAKDRDLTFEFTGNKITVREKGNVVEELVKL